MVNFKGKSEENPKSKTPTQGCPARTKLKATALCSVWPWELRRSHKADKEVTAVRQGAAPAPAPMGLKGHSEGCLSIGGHRKANLKTN